MPKIQPNDFLKLLWDMGSTNLEVANMLDVSERTIYRWLDGTRRIPYAAYRAIQLEIELRRLKSEM
jgi:hypothetical protein